MKLSIYDNTSETALTNGAGIISNSGSLFKDDGTNTIITSHNGANFSDLFMNISKLQKDDTFYIKNDKGEVLEYKVFDIKTVDPQGELDTFLVAPSDKDWFTLRTCTPTGAHRVHVTGEFTKYIEEDEIPESEFTLSRYEMSMIGLFMVSFISLGVMLVQDRKKKKEDLSNEKN